MIHIRKTWAGVTQLVCLGIAILLCLAGNAIYRTFEIKLRYLLLQWTGNTQAGDMLLPIVGIFLLSSALLCTLYKALYPRDNPFAWVTRKPSRLFWPLLLSAGLAFQPIYSLFIALSSYVMQSTLWFWCFQVLGAVLHIAVYSVAVLLVCRAACFGGIPKMPQIRSLFARRKCKVLALCGGLLILLGQVVDWLISLSLLSFPEHAEDSLLGVLDVLAISERWSNVSRTVQEVGFYAGTFLLLVAFYLAAHDRLEMPEFRRTGGFQEESPFDNGEDGWDGEMDKESQETIH